MGPEDLAERAGGHLAAQAVDVDLLILVLLTHEVLLSLGVQRPEDQGQGSSNCQGVRLWFTLGKKRASKEDWAQEESIAGDKEAPWDRKSWELVRSRTLGWALVTDQRE